MRELASATTLESAEANGGTKAKGETEEREGGDEGEVGPSVVLSGGPTVLDETAVEAVITLGALRRHPRQRMCTQSPHASQR